MLSINTILMILCGFAAGLTTAVAYVAFITVIGIFPKLSQKMSTASECILFENCLMLGIMFATFLQFFLTYETAGIQPNGLPNHFIGIIILIILGGFGGIYTGFLIGGLAEILNVIPIYSRKTHISKYVSCAIISIALGKGFFLLIDALHLVK